MCLLHRRRSGVVQAACGRRGLGAGGGRTRSDCIGRGMRVWIMQEEELDGAAGDEAGDVRGGIAVDVL